MIATLSPTIMRRSDLKLPSELEARCYLMSKKDGMTQFQIAESLQISQSTVARAVERCELKIEALKKSGRFDPDEIDTLLRRLIGQAAHSARLI